MREFRETGNGIGILTVVQIVFIILKLTNLVDWSWWIVFWPSWISLGLFCLVVIIIAIIWFFIRRK